jgi:carbon-monoxide dehydrogenase large subunit
MHGGEHPAASGEIGRSRTRVEDRRLVMGAGRYLDDVVLPRALWLAFVRSPYPHARVTRVDTAAAQGAAGVVAVLGGQDVPPIARPYILPRIPDPRVPPFEPLARDTVRFVGMPVAVVAAESAGAALDAAALVDVAYEPLPAVVDAEAALRGGAPLVWPDLGTNVCFQVSQRAGDPEAAFARAARVVPLRVSFPRLAPAPLEPRGVVASYEPHTEELTAWITTQMPHGARDLLAGYLGLPEHRVRVIAPDMGGGFGGRGPGYPEYLVAALLAQRLGRPVRAVTTRSEDVATTTHARDSVIDVAAALDAEGRLIGLRARIVTNLGAMLYMSALVPTKNVIMMLPGCYRVQDVAIEATGVFTHTNPTGPYRGAGRPEAADTIERLMDAVARALDADPVDLRRRNLIGRDEFPYQTATGHSYDSGDYAAALDRVLEQSDYRGWKARQAAERARGERTLLGVGLATFVDSSAVGWESGHVRVESSGRVTATAGASAHGQGHETTFAQVLADRLGIPFDQIVVRHGDTAIAPPGIGTFGSRSLVLAGGALVQAADEVLGRARQLAAGLLEADTADVEQANGGFRVAGSPDRTVTWAQVAGAAYGRRRGPRDPDATLGLEAGAYFNVPQNTFAFGAAVAVVRVDPDTGHVAIEHLYVVHDCGVVVNPLLVDGQVYGGTAQGLGEALCEQVVYQPDGGLATGSLMHYALPRATDMPAIDLAETCTPSPLNPLGAKGVGESGTIIGTGPIMNAVVDALAPLGITHLDMPYTAERVWSAIQQARAGV